jgi:glycerol dehydrogenase-like iron-containing ADH family enzyme
LEFKNFAKGGISKMTLKEKAQRLLSDFKGDDYALGVGIINKIGEYAKEYGENVLLISNDTYRETAVTEVEKSIKNLPDSFTIDELIEQLIFIEKLEEGIKQSNEQKIVSSEDVRKMIDKWSD